MLSEMLSEILSEILSEFQSLVVSSSLCGPCYLVVSLVHPSIHLFKTFFQKSSKKAQKIKADTFFKRFSTFLSLKKVRKKVLTFLKSCKKVCDFFTTFCDFYRKRRKKSQKVADFLRLFKNVCPKSRKNVVRNVGSSMMD